MCACFVVLTSPAVAAAVDDVPVLGQLCRILTGQAYESREETSYVQVQLPQIENTGDSSLEQRVNLEISAVLSREVVESKERARQYYQAYLDTGGDPDTFQPIQIQVDYQVKSVTDQWASFVVTKTESLASAYFRQYFYNLDLETGQSLTLRDVLGPNWAAQGAAAVEEQLSQWDQEQKALLFDDVDLEALLEEKEDFYLQEDGTVVVVFDKYEIAAGAAGVLEFPIGARVRRTIHDQVFAQIDPMKAATTSRDNLAEQVAQLIREICDQNRFQLTAAEEQAISAQMLDEMLGIGPIEPLLADETVTDILVNGADKVFVERFGKLELTPITFIDEEHVFNIAQRIAARVGRRIDEANPMVDARLADGSRVNVVTKPLALDGTSISIRKFSKHKRNLEELSEGGALTKEMVELLSRAVMARLNIVVSGGTGAGKTTLLNALSFKIGQKERVVTIEDAAELQLNQEDIVRLETRPESIEGGGQITQRDLVKNALRMRPDRIILGEVRGGECFDMLQAMNTGHDGSLCTVHANNARDALIRLENMVLMANLQLPLNAIRRQIGGAVNMVVQIERMRDGKRRVVSIVEVCGMEEDVIQTQELYNYRIKSISADGRIVGEFVNTGLRPKFYQDRAHLFGGN